MIHYFILEPSLDNFLGEIKKSINNGFKQVVGSVYTKSIETGIPVSQVSSNLNDVEGVFSISMENEQGVYTVVIEEDPDDFFMATTDLVDKGYNIITGSLYINSTKDTYQISTIRYYNTWYSCTMYKH